MPRLLADRQWLLPLLTLLLTMSAGGARAQVCDCLWQGPFVEAQQRADLVLMGTVTMQRGNAFDVDVEAVLRGSTFAETVRVWGSINNYPGTCRAPAAHFQPGSRWVLALQAINQVPPGGFNPATPNRSYGRRGDYALSRCGVYWLEVHDGLVRGNLATDHRWQYQDDEMEPVRPALLADWLRGDLPLDSLIKAAAPNPEAQRLREATQRFLRDQADDPADPADDTPRPAAPALPPPTIAPP